MFRAYNMYNHLQVKQEFPIDKIGQATQYLDILLCYPLKYLIPYKKITNSIHYKPTSYSQISFSITFTTEIIVQFILLLLKSFINRQSLEVAIRPGRLFNKKIHFYRLEPNKEKGFRRIEGCFSSQINKFMDQIEQVNIIDLSKQDKQLFFGSLTQWLKKQLSPSWQLLKELIQAKKDYLMSVVQFINKLGTQPILSKFSNVFRIYRSLYLLKIIKDRYFVESYLAVNQKNKDLLSRNQLIYSCFANLNKMGLINNLEEKKEIIQIQNRFTQEVIGNQFFSRFKFTKNLFDIGHQPQTQKAIFSLDFNSIEEFCEKLNIEISVWLESQKQVQISTSVSFWNLKKEQYVKIESVWLKIRLQSIKTRNKEMFPQSFFSDFSKMDISLNSNSNIQLISTCKCASPFILMSIDKHILILGLFSSFFSNFYKKESNLNYDSEELDFLFSQGYIEYLSDTLKKWTTHLSYIISQCSKAPRR